MSEQKTFLGGLPYAPDVKRLEAAFPVEQLKEGRLISHSELEAVIGKRDDIKLERYYGVVNSWKKTMLNSHGKFTAWQSGDGIKVLPPHEILKHGESKIQSGLRITVKGIKVLPHVQAARLDASGVKRYEKVCEAAAKLQGAIGQGKKSLAIEPAARESLPIRRIA